MTICKHAKSLGYTSTKLTPNRKGSESAHEARRLHNLKWRRVRSSEHAKVYCALGRAETQNRADRFVTESEISHMNDPSSDQSIELGKEVEVDQGRMTSLGV